MKRFAGEKDEAIVAIPLIVEMPVVVVEPRLAVVTIDVEQVRVTVTVGHFVYITIHDTEA